MIDLKDINAIKEIDPQNTLESSDLLVTQCMTALEQVSNINFPSYSGEIKNIIFCGMGASIYGALVLKALIGAEIKYPIEIVSDYNLPLFANNESLVVLTSYSGTTEEVLSCAGQAKEKNCKMLVLTKGDQLAEFAKNNSIPSYIFDGKLNPAGIPRLGAGYTIIGLLSLLHKTGIISLDENALKTSLDSLLINNSKIKELAMEHSEYYTNIIPIIFAAEHLSGNAQILRNQFNETSKTFSSFFLIPDLNHHLMEGLRFPEEAKLRFLTFQSDNYSAKIQKRVNLTVDVVKKNNREIDVFKTTGKTKYDDFLEVLVYGSYLTLYLGLRYEQNPAINPWVDYFKEELAK